MPSLYRCITPWMRSHHRYQSRKSILARVPQLRQFVRYNVFRSALKAKLTQSLFCMSPVESSYQGLARKSVNRQRVEKGLVPASGWCLLPSAGYHLSFWQQVDLCFSSSPLSLWQDWSTTQLIQDNRVEKNTRQCPCRPYLSPAHLQVGDRQFQQSQHHSTTRECSSNLMSSPKCKRPFSKAVHGSGRAVLLPMLPYQNPV